MVFETLALVCSWHPGHESDYRADTPGAFIAVTRERDMVTPYAVAGAYLDSFGKPAYVAGIGCDVGLNYGAGLTIGYVGGSGVGAGVPIPSLFYRGERHGVRVIIAPRALAFGYSYSFTP